jgi:hypothetical protein
MADNRRLLDQCKRGTGIWLALFNLGSSCVAQVYDAPRLCC